ncbi:MAG TPA: substrate-binding domain-containing protein, partial [Halobacteriales archaeon]|nr:substrate-binding domain-containing protein [Halobacteriales archaeon]
MEADRGRGGGVTRRRALGAVGAAGLVSLAGCVVGADGGDRGSVAIAGSSTVYPVSKALAEEYFKAYPDAEITVSSTGTGAGFSNFFCTGKTDINDASRQVKASERDLCAGAGITPLEFQVATDALTIIVNPEVDWVDCLGFEELQAIWGPDDPAERWSDVRDDWPDREMNLYGPTAASGT